MHGGDVYRNHIKYDFSVNINPLGICPRVKKAVRKALGKIEQYPDSKCEKLTEELASLFNVNSDLIVCGNGASELIGAVFRVAEEIIGDGALKILLPSPGFTGYEVAAESLEGGIRRYHFAEKDDFAFSESVFNEIKENLENESCSIVLITNPNNPNGKLLSVEQVKKIAELCKNVLLLIDESFIELSDSGQSFVPFLKDFPNVVILHSFTKSFAIPGLRLGYCICGDFTVAQKIKKQLCEWNVSVVAQEAGLACIKEYGKGKYLQKSRALISNERKYLSEELQKMNFKVYDSDADFLLFYCEKSWCEKSGGWEDSSPLALDEYLLEKGILIRDCSDYEGLTKGFYRIAVKTHRENRILVKEIGKY